MDYSIIICVYNPDQRILERCLTAVSKLNRTSLVTETLLIDNNSVIPVAHLNYIKPFEESIENFHHLFVKEQGVNHARISGIDASKGKYILYIDSDNEPFADYLQELEKLHIAYPQVAAWGPGNVWVDFIDGVENSLLPYATKAFQERHETDIAYDDKTDWQHAYPFGTGLCSNGTILKKYNQLAREGKFSLSGRTGMKLSSGEDTQMVLLAISMGFSAGVAPTLKLKHMIPASRSNSAYLLRLAYGTSLCYESCVMEVFPGKKQTIEEALIPAATLKRRLVKKWISARFSKKQETKFELAYYTGLHAGRYLALGKSIPHFVQSFAKWMKFE